MGLHSGIADAGDVVYNATRGMMTYGGKAAVMAKAVSDAAAGGMVREARGGLYFAFVPVLPVAWLALLSVIYVQSPARHPARAA